MTCDPSVSFTVHTSESQCSSIPSRSSSKILNDSISNVETSVPSLSNTGLLSSPIPHKVGNFGVSVSVFPLSLSFPPCVPCCKSSHPKATNAIRQIANIFFIRLIIIQTYTKSYMIIRPGQNFFSGEIREGDPAGYSADLSLTGRTGKPQNLKTVATEGSPSFQKSRQRALSWQLSASI